MSSDDVGGATEAVGILVETMNVLRQPVFVYKRIAHLRAHGERKGASRIESARIRCPGGSG
jgi:hypothetical protein